MTSPSNAGRDPVSRLEALGAVVVPPPSEDLVDVLVAERLPHRAPEPARRAHVVKFPVLLPAAAIAAAVLGFVLVATHHDSSPGNTVVLQTAVDASVEKDGLATTAKPGTKLAEGSVITIGPSGTVTVGGVTLGPGERAVIRKGKLEKLREALESTPTTSTAAPNGSGDATTATPAWEKLPIAVDLEARRSATGAVNFVWTQYGGPSFGAYVVVREDRTIVARRPAVTELRAGDRTPPSTRTRYVLVVLDANRRPVARSEVVSV